VLRTGLRLSLETLVFTILPVCFLGALLQRVLTAADAVKRTIEVVLQFKEDYAPGDTFCLACPNDTAEVTDLMEQLGCTAVADKQMALTIDSATKKKRAAVPQHVVGACTLRECLTALCDLRAPLTKANLCVLAECTAAASERHYLSYLCSRQGSAAYMERLQAHGLSAAALLRLYVLDALVHHSTVNVRWSHYLSPIRPCTEQVLTLYIPFFAGKQMSFVHCPARAAA